MTPEQIIEWVLLEAPIANAVVAALASKGYVIVPKEPTQAMLDRGTLCLPGRGAKSLWLEMIDAAETHRMGT